MKQERLGKEKGRGIGSADPLLFIGVFRRGNKPPVLLGVREGFSKAKTGELKASPRNLAKR